MKQLVNIESNILIGWVKPRKCLYWPTAEFGNQASSPPITSGVKHVILDSTTKEIQGLDPGLEKSIARVKSKGETRL
jgi:hypothetical protein